MIDKILIVDDDPAVLKTVKLYLSKAGFDVVTCEDGGQAVCVAEREHPQLVIMDILMQGVDGIESVHRLKKESATKDIPVIFLTGLGDAKGDEHKANQIIFAKPVDMKKLIESIRHLLHPAA